MCFLFIIVSIKSVTLQNYVTIDIYKITIYFANFFYNYSIICISTSFFFFREGEIVYTEQT